MSVFLIVFGLIVLTLIGLFLYVMFRPKPAGTDVITLVPGSMSGKTSRSYAKQLPLAFNQEQGATFSYTGWLVVNDYTFNYGKKRPVFSKGDCPGLYIDSTSNSLLIAVKTYANTPETILISNLPAKKWIHFGIVVNQDAVNVYINGVLRQHHTLAQLPKQNTEPVVIGSDTLGFDGVLSNLQYVPRSLSGPDIDALASNVPTDDLHVPPSKPQYFDISWYTGRLTSF
jgi:hypothetical protein